LILAAHSGHADTVRILLQNGADVNAANDEGMTALKSAEKRSYEDIVDMLKKAARNYSGG